MLGISPGRAGQLALHEVAERLASDVDILAVAIDEIHRHVEHVVDIALEPHAVLERERQGAAAVGIGVGPDMAAEAHEAVGLAVGEGRVREQCGRDRLQCQRHAQLLHHVRFAGEIEVGLHRAGAGHHVEAELALALHLLAHDLVAALGHPRRVGARPLGVHAHAEQPDLQLAADLLHLLQVPPDLGAGLVDRAQRRARQLELPARLQRDAAAFHGERDDVAVLLDRLPAEALQPAQQRADAVRLFVADGAQRLQVEHELLVLSPDPPLRPRLVALLEILDQLSLAGDGGAARLWWCRHRCSYSAPSAPVPIGIIGCGGRSVPSPRIA